MALAVNPAVARYGPVTVVGLLLFFGLGVETLHAEDIWSKECVLCSCILVLHFVICAPGGGALWYTCYTHFFTVCDPLIIG